MKSILILILFLLVIFVPAKASISSVEWGPVPCSVPTSTAPVWGKLVLSGNNVTCYYAVGAATPTSWKQIGQVQTIGFANNPLLVGLFFTAHNASALGGGTIDNFSITPAPTYRLQDSDIGAPALMGSANLIKGVWTLAGSGADIWGTADQFNFQPWLVWGDCTIICRVTSITSGNVWEKIGIMVRDGYNSGSDYAMFCATNGQGVDFQYRPAFNDNPDGATIATLVAPPPPTNTSAGTAVGVNPIGTSSSFFVLRP
jgi:hypothetical protein